MEVRCCRKENHEMEMVMQIDYEITDIGNWMTLNGKWIMQIGKWMTLNGNG